MSNEMMDLEQLAVYLRRDLREVTKLASRGHFPGQKVAGQWRFARVEINHWIEKQIHNYSDHELTAIERHDSPSETAEPLLATLLTEASMAVPLTASTRAAVLRQLVALAEQTWQVYDPDAIFEAVRQREEMHSTALDTGVALPHPHRPLPGALGESIVAYGRTTSGIPFGGPSGTLTDIFFLVCCRDDRTHLQVLARLSRLFLRPGFLEELRSADNSSDSLQVITAAEGDLLGSAAD